MSASEKLKAHGGVFRLMEVGTTSAAYVEVSFWPQIVAVVEAAEQFAAKVERGEAKSVRSYGAFVAALSALDEALW